jgi:hypothetical protein
VCDASEPVNDILFRKSNVVMLWDNAPTSDESATLDNCIS